MPCTCFSWPMFSKMPAVARVACCAQQGLHFIGVHTTSKVGMQVQAMGSLKAGSNLVASMPPSGKAEGGPGAIAASFAAGILAHLPALVVWTLPSVASYDRLQPGTWSGCFRCCCAAK